MSQINILYTFDTRFWKLAAVSMYSLLKNKKNDTNYKIYCMVAPHTRGRRRIMNIVRKFPGTGLVWRPIQARENPFRTYDFSRWSPVIFYRLFPWRVFPNLDKILYLDSDTIICDDLSSLFKTSVSKHVFGAVPDMAPHENPDDENGKYIRDFSQKHLNNGPYFNSGVLLIDLKKLRKYEQLIKNIKADLKYPDQDLLNIGFAGKIKPLELKYNLIPGVTTPKHFSQQQARTAQTSPSILHFYAAKPYFYSFVPREVYSIFYKTTAEIGMHPEDFIKHEMRYAKGPRRRTAKEAFRPFKVHNNKICLFGIPIARL